MMLVGREPPALLEPLLGACAGALAAPWAGKVGGGASVVMGGSGVPAWLPRRLRGGGMRDAAVSAWDSTSAAFRPWSETEVTVRGCWSPAEAVSPPLSRADSSALCARVGEGGLLKTAELDAAERATDGSTLDA